MRMKSYFADSVQIAMENARRELGGEAILVTSRLAPAEPGKARQYEVVFATEVPEKSALSRPPRTPAAEPGKTVQEAAVTAGSLEAMLAEIRGIRKEIQTWLPQAGDPSGSGAGSAKEILTHLTNADMDPDLAQQLVAAALERLSSRPQAGPAGGPRRFGDALRMASSKLEASGEDLRCALAACIADVFRVETGLTGTSSGAAVVALIGPPGVGKTSAIAKLAVRYGLQERKPGLLLSVDNLRVAASEQLRGYAAVIGMRFELAQSARALKLLLEEHRSCGLILIDTPGFSLGELSEGSELADFLAGRAGIQKHLVLPAPARCGDMNRIRSAWEVFRPSHLIFSRMDETTVFGPALSEAMGSGRPVSFFSTGPRVPEDISEACADIIAARLLPTLSTQRGIAAAA